jgi:hypothetical protein
MKLQKSNLIKAFDSAVVLIGILMISIGLYKIYPPAMWIVTGIILAFPGIPRKAVK